MYVETFYNKDRDRGVTVPGMSADISQIIETGIIEDIGLAPEFNDFDDPSQITGRANDVFEAIEAAKARLVSQKVSEAQALQMAQQAVKTSPSGSQEPGSVTPSVGEGA